MKRWILLSAAFIGLTAIGLAQESARGVSATEAIAARQATLDMSSITFRYIDSAIQRGDDPKGLAYPAAALAKWAKVLPAMFPPGTGRGETSAFSQALPSIWKDRAGFERAAANYAEATSKLAALAQASDKPGFIKQLGFVNDACAACHALYKDGDKSGPRRN